MPVPPRFLVHQDVASECESRDDAERVLGNGLRNFYIHSLIACSPPMKKLQPISSAKLSSIGKLLQKKYRIESKRFLVEGLRTVEEALASDWAVETVLLRRNVLADSSCRELLHLAAQKEVPSYQITEEAFEKISDTVHSQGILAVVRQKSYGMDVFDTSNPGFIVVALDGIMEPGNMGAIIRTCDWFGVDALLFGKGSVEFFNPKVVRSAMGSTFHIPFVADVSLPSALEELKGKGFAVYASISQDGEAIEKIPWKQKPVIVFGNEVHGVSRDVLRIADEKLTVPRFGGAESLNVGVACGVVLGLLRTTLSSE